MRQSRVKWHRLKRVEAKRRVCHIYQFNALNAGGEMNVIVCLILTLAVLSPAPTAPEIAGTIVDDHGKIASRIPLSVVSLPSDQVVAKTLSAPDGSFSFAGLTSGNYGLQAKTDSACAFSNAIQVHEGFTSIVRLRLVSGFCRNPIALGSPLASSPRHN